MMTPRNKPGKNAVVGLEGVLAKAEAGRVAAKGVSRTGGKRRGKYDYEALRGYEFNAEGHLMQKERIFDRRNPKDKRYKELVVDTDTGKVVRDVEEPLSEHTGHGSAKHKRQTGSS